MLCVDLKSVMVLAPFGEACCLKRAERVVFKLHDRDKAIIHVCYGGGAIVGWAGGHPVFKIPHHRFGFPYQKASKINDVRS